MCSKLTVNGETELAEASVQRIETRFDCLDHSRVESCECVMLRVRRRCIWQRRQFVPVDDAKVTAAQKAGIRWLDRGLKITRSRARRLTT